MDNAVRFLFAASMTLSVVAAQPYIYSVANSASYDQGAIAQGSMFVIFGSGMGPGSVTQAGSFPLPSTLAGTSVSVISGGTTIPCPLVYTSSSQAAAIMPSATPVGRVMVVVTYSGQSSGTTAYSNDFFVTVVPSSVGIYALNSQGTGPGIFTAVDGSLFSFTKPAQAGDAVTLWATGIGPVAGGDAGPPQAVNVPGVEVYVGVQAAKVLYAGRSPCCAGLDQISFTAPQAGDSCFMPVVVRSGGLLSNVVTLSTGTTASPCSDAGPAVPSAIYTRAIQGQTLTVGTLVIGPVGILSHLGFDQRGYYAASLSAALHRRISPQDADALLRALAAHSEARVRRAMWKYRKSWRALDPQTKKGLLEQANFTQVAASAGFGVVSSVASAMALLTDVSTPAGACTMVQNLPPLRPARSRALDAGASLTVNGPAGTISLTGVQGGQYQGLLGGSVKGPNVPPGAYTIAGKGGRDVGPFATTLNVSANIIWTNKAALSVLDRSQPLTVSWTGGTVPGHVLIGGYQSGSNEAGSARAFLCTEETSRGLFIVPAVFLSGLKPTSGPVTLFVGQHPLERAVAIPGLDIAWFIDGSSDSVTVAVK